MQTCSKRWTKTGHKPEFKYHQYLERTGTEPNCKENFLLLWLPGNTWALALFTASGTEVSIIAPFCFPNTINYSCSWFSVTGIETRWLLRTKRNMTLDSTQIAIFIGNSNCTDFPPLAVEGSHQQCEYALSVEGLGFGNQFSWMVAGKGSAPSPSQVNTAQGHLCLWSATSKIRLPIALKRVQMLYPGMWVCVSVF